MSEVITGILEAVNPGDVRNGKFGPFYRHGYKINGEWYNSTSNEAAPSVSTGETVAITYEIREFNGRKSNDVTKGGIAKIKAHSAPASTGQSANAPAKQPSDYAIGARVGQAVNLAFQEALKLEPGEVNLNKVYERAFAILEATDSIHNDYLRSRQ